MDSISNNIKVRNERIKWFQHDRFGMFIHWGLYAIPSKGEWLRSFGKISKEEYMKYFNSFNPTRYTPKAWAKLAKEAGMKYMVMTAKHHDGFCLFDSQLTDFKATNTKAGRDLILEYTKACREEGLKVGIYYSTVDWYHKDYPAFGDLYHPMREEEDYRNKEHNFSRYLEYMHGQVRELLTNYGKIDDLFFDFSYDQYTGEAWKATELVNMIRTLQPEIIINNRLGGGGHDNGLIKDVNPPVFAGDYACPEQIMPPKTLMDDGDNPIPWEINMTMNNSWGYAANDKDFKSSKQIIRALVETVSKGGNLLLNVGPDPKGDIPEESIQILTEVGRWMKKNSESIYGCGICDFPKPEWGRYTQNGRKLYAHILDRSIGPICLSGVEEKINEGYFLENGSEVKIGRPHFASDYKENIFIILESNKLPDDIDTVVEIILKER